MSKTSERRLPLKDSKKLENELVIANPLSSAEALKQRTELTLNTKEKTRRKNESPILKSLFDFKGNSKHRDQDDNQEARKSFNNFDAKEPAERGLTLSKKNPVPFKNPF